MGFSAIGPPELAKRSKRMIEIVADDLLGSIVEHLVREREQPFDLGMARGIAIG